MSLGEVRRSQVISTYGPGSLVAVDDASYMVVGTDSWFEGAQPDPTYVIHEPRLENFLGVSGFVLPPSGEADRSRDLPVTRFPVWVSCSGCDRLGPYFKLSGADGSCGSCGKRLTTSRFIAVCEAGHAMDFPYFQWVHQKPFASDVVHELSYRTQGLSAGLGDIVISCSCEQERDMEGALGRFKLAGLSCPGEKPWLINAERDSNCDKVPRGSQRGASTVWQSVTHSSISIPPWSREANRFIDRFWMVLGKVPTESLDATVRNLAVAFPVRCPLSEILEAVQERKRLEQGEPLRLTDMFRQEYDALCRSLIADEDDDSYFLCERVGPELVLPPGIEFVSRVKRLREVRALEGFFRMTSGNVRDASKCSLSENRLWWLPGIEVLGEGIFLKFDQFMLDQWESNEFVRARVAQVVGAAKDETVFFDLPEPSPRAILIHTVAHLLMDQWSLECGYPTASLRERIYVGDDMAGVLIYTATSDSQGSMGGLVGMTKQGRFETAFTAAVRRSEWCSNDPVCMERGPNGFAGLNRAACHSCCHVPETSCVWRNSLLDRAFVVGSPDGCPGFFN